MYKSYCKVRWLSTKSVPVMSWQLACCTRKVITFKFLLCWIIRALPSMRSSSVKRVQEILSVVCLVFWQEPFQWPRLIQYARFSYRCTWSSSCRYYALGKAPLRLSSWRFPISSVVQAVQYRRERNWCKSRSRTASSQGPRKKVLQSRYIWRILAEDMAV
jgi:hypothetical protein